MRLTAEQLARAVEVMQAYLHAPATSDGQTPSELSAAGDKEREALARVKRVLNDYTLASDLDRQFGDMPVSLRKILLSPRTIN